MNAKNYMDQIISARKEERIECAIAAILSITMGTAAIYLMHNKQLFDATIATAYFILSTYSTITDFRAAQKHTRQIAQLKSHEHQK